MSKYDEEYDNIEKVRDKCRSSYEDSMYQKDALENYFQNINFRDKDVNFQYYFEEEYNRMHEYSKQMEDIDNSLDNEVRREIQLFEERKILKEGENKGGRRN